MIRMLRTDRLAERAGVAASSKPHDLIRGHEFHDKLLSYGGPSILLLRKEIRIVSRQNLLCYNDLQPWTLSAIYSTNDANQQSSPAAEVGVGIMSMGRS